jgi:hypothetical protein
MPGRLRVHGWRLELRSAGFVVVGGTRRTLEYFENLSIALAIRRTAAMDRGVA